MCDFILSTYTVLCIEQLTYTVFLESAFWYFRAHWSLWKQKKYPYIRVERSFWRDCFLICDFILQSYTVLFTEQFANTVFLESAKRSLGVHWGLWWKRKHPQIKTRKKLSNKLLCNVWIHLTVLHHSFHWSVC